MFLSYLFPTTETGISTSILSIIIKTRPVAVAS